MMLKEAYSIVGKAIQQPVISGTYGGMSVGSLAHSPVKAGGREQSPNTAPIFGKMLYMYIYII